MHLASLVEDFRAHAGETAIVAHRGNRRYPTSYGELARLAGRFAAELERRGVAPGERVVLWGENSAEWVGVFFGCLLRGALVVPLDAAGSREFAARVMDEVRPRLIVGDALLLRGLRTEVPSLELGGVDEALPDEPDFRPSEAVREEAAFQIVFTSGTTSEPKGIVHTHRNVLASLRPIESEIGKYRRYERWVHPLRFLHTLPLSHVFGQFMGLWVPALLAAEVHFGEALEPVRTIELIRRERISVLVAVPRVLGLLRAQLLRQSGSLGAQIEAARGLPVLKRWWRFRAVHRAFGLKFWAVICGGASLPAELESFWNTLGFALIQGYGMTETAALVTLNHPFRIGQGTIGKALPGREVRLGEGGEILVRGEMLSTATWQGGRMQAREGDWLATGDLAEESGSGDLRFVGRKGDAIVNAAGLNIYPADLEAAMARQPGVRGCVVVGCEGPAGMEPVAVVLSGEGDAAVQQAVEGANRELAAYQQVRRVLRWPELDFPYTSTGKLLRRKVALWACAAMKAAGGPSGPSGGSGPSQGDALLSLIAEAMGGPLLAGIARADDLRLDSLLDSLGRVQLASLVEQRMGVELRDDQVASLATLGELRALVDQSVAGGEPAARLLQRDSTLPVAGSAERHADHVYARWPWSRPVLALRVAFIEAVLRPLVWFLASPRVEAVGASGQSLPPVSSGPMLIVANHVTAYDGALVLYALPPGVRRRVAIAMSGEMLLDYRRGRGQGGVRRNIFGPVAWWLLTALFNVFPLPRLQGFRRSFAHAGEAMDRGYAVLIFPEGTRSRGGQMQVFRPGIGLLAQQSRLPVLPVALLGLGEVSGAGWFRSGRLEVRVGELVRMPEETTPAEWTSALESALRRLQGRPEEDASAGG